VCPVPDAIVLERRARSFVPVAGPAACTGCGACEQHCPAEGAIRILPARADARGRVCLTVAGSDAD
jgi:NAD-dependent dihydropyrimidine dehydrogenase PreA subunit